MVFGLWTALGGHGAPGLELAHNVRRSPEEVAAVLAEAEQAGGRIVRPAVPADWHLLVTEAGVEPALRTEWITTASSHASGSRG